MSIDLLELCRGLNPLKLVKGADMCNLDRVAGFLIGAKVAYLAMLGFLVAAAVSSGGVFTAGAAVGFMAGAIVSAAVATGLFVTALIDINSCAGPCSGSLAEVRTWLITTIALMGTITGMLLALAIVAPVPVAGAVAITPAVAFLTMGAGVLLGIDAVVATKLASALSDFNSCQAARSRPSSSVLATIFAVASWVGAIAGGAVGLVAGTLYTGIAILGTGSVIYGWVIPFSITISYGDQSGPGAGDAPK